MDVQEVVGQQPAADNLKEPVVEVKVEVQRKNEDQQPAGKSVQKEPVVEVEGESKNDDHQPAADKLKEEPVAEVEVQRKNEDQQPAAKSVEKEGGASEGPSNEKDGSSKAAGDVVKKKPGPRKINPKRRPQCKSHTGRQAVNIPKVGMPGQARVQVSPAPPQAGNPPVQDVSGQFNASTNVKVNVAPEPPRPVNPEAEEMAILEQFFPQPS